MLYCVGEPYTYPGGALFLPLLKHNPPDGRSDKRYSGRDNERYKTAGFSTLVAPKLPEGESGSR